MSDQTGTLEIRNISDLVPYEKNAKKHPTEQIQKLTVQIKKHGWTQPIVIQKSSSVIIAGHGRRLAALQMGLIKVPVIVVDVTDEEARAMRIADNAVVSKDFDVSLLQEEAVDLKLLGMDMELLGLDDNDLQFMIDDVSAMDMSAFEDDISTAVETQKDENKKKQSKIDETEIALKKGFGFSSFTVSQTRVIKDLMTKIEEHTGETGANALITHLQETT